MSSQGADYAAFIAAELKAEQDRRDNANSRAATMLTAATGLVTIVVSVFTVIHGKDFILTASAKAALIVALLALLVTAALSLVASLARTYETASPATLRRMLDAHWTDSEAAARNITASCNIHTLETLRAGTNFKYRTMWLAGGFQLIATLALIVCVGIAV
ncbi:hypothetical protein ACFXHA_05375 [Nocardia sp. NPDC059240]|uniref:hypothetical protein n=1 Tax=Nocardia sp. NPDC059240 TaxID=3346786 RepID=UPI0036AE0E49